MISGISSTAISMTSSNGSGPAVSGAPNPAATTAPIAALKITGSNTGEPAVQNIKINTQQIEEAVSKINSQLSTPAGLSFQIDPSSGDSVITVIDSSNNTVIRQIPSELSLRIAQSIENQQSKGLLVSDKA
jgi:flagellar protein FlaG